MDMDKWKHRSMYYLNAIDMDKSEKDGEEHYKDWKMTCVNMKL